jgi:hypothetical protein
MADRKIRARIGAWMRKWADRIDYAGAPKITHWTFTFERGKGLVFREDGRGCMVAYLGDAEYDKAHAESDTARSDEQWKRDRFSILASEQITFRLRAEAARNDFPWINTPS